MDDDGVLPRSVEVLDAGMTDLPSDTLALFDSEGVLFGHVRIADSERPGRIDCIFDIQDGGSPDPAARWLAKRHYQRWSEHRLTMNEEGVLTIKKASFSVTFAPEEQGGFVSVAPAPRIFADWEKA